MLGSDRFQFETPNVIDPGDLPPSRPCRPDEDDDDNTNVRFLEEKKEDEGLLSGSQPRRDSHHRRLRSRELLKDMDDLDQLTKDYDPYEDDPEDQPQQHDQLPSVEEARLYASTLLLNKKSKPFNTETMPFGNTERIPLDRKRRHLVRQVLMRYGVRIGLVLGLLAVTILIGVAISNAATRNKSGPNLSRSESKERHTMIFDNLVATGVSSREDLERPGSPQYLAVQWITDTDALQYDVDSPRFVQRYALAVLFFATQGTSWNSTLNWMTDVDECSWYESEDLHQVEHEVAVGVTCTTELEVRSLYLPNNNLQGRLPSELTHLPMLDTLQLGRNALTGTIPQDALSGLTNLIYLDLGYNVLSGNIPDWMGDLQQLEVLGLSNNALAGTVPSSLGWLNRLKTLALDDNFLEGDLDFVQNLENLEFLYLNNNFFMRNVNYAFLEHSMDLKELDLSGNQLHSDKFPEQFFEMPRLRVLDLADNNFQGPLPDAIGSNYVLEYLSVRNNALTGKIPISLPYLHKLTHLDLHNNQLEDWIPGRMDTMTNLTYLALGENNFYPAEMPGLLAQLTNLRELSMPNTQLYGSLPEQWLELLQDLELLDLSHNQLTGTIPPSVWDLPNLSYLVLHQNELEGTIPSYVEGASQLRVLSLFRNPLLSGDLTPLCEAATNLEWMATDCSITCSSCCTPCCEEGDQGCYDVALDDLPNYMTEVEGSWEFNYTRASYSSDPAILEESGVAVAFVIPFT